MNETATVFGNILPADYDGRPRVYKDEDGHFIVTRFDAVFHAKHLQTGKERTVTALELEGFRESTPEEIRRLGIKID